MRDPNLEWWMVKAWPLRWRRAFMVTLPVSGPLYILFLVGLAFGFLIFCAVFALPICFLLWLKEELWDEQLHERR